jgi:hypothetical protein
MKEYNEIVNEINKQSDELIQDLENDLEIEMVRQELVELKQQQSKVNKIMLLGANVTALYGLMLAVKIIMTMIY